MRIFLVLIAASLVLGACSDDGSPRSAAPSPSAQPSEKSQPSERGITRPDGTTVHNGAHGSSKRLVKIAIADLKDSGLWRPLTKHLYVIKVSSRLGRENVPEDGHLADAYLTAQIDDGVGGSLCDIMFFPTAMADDLTRWRTYNAQGLLAEPAPSRRFFWASILAHELAHCLDHGSGEDVAERWEAKALARLRSRKS